MFNKPIRQAKKLENVLGSAVWHLTQGDKSISELRVKLERKTDNADWIDTTIERMMEIGYLKNDYDFAVRLIESHFGNEFGVSAIKRKLKSKGINASDAEEALEFVINDLNIDQYKLAESRLLGRFQDFHSTTIEKLHSQMNTKGFSRSEIDQAISNHPAKDTLRSKIDVKADRLDLETEITKLYRKGKGRSVIQQALKMKRMDLENFNSIVDRLCESGDIDFFESAQTALEKKRYDLKSGAGKSKAYGHLASKGFSSEEIKEAISACSLE